MDQSAPGDNWVLCAFHLWIPSIFLEGNLEAFSVLSFLSPLYFCVEGYTAKVCTSSTSRLFYVLCHCLKSEDSVMGRHLCFHNWFEVWLLPADEGLGTFLHSKIWVIFPLSKKGAPFVDVGTSIYRALQSFYRPLKIRKWLESVLGINWYQYFLNFLVWKYSVWSLIFTLKVAWTL